MRSTTSTQLELLSVLRNRFGYHEFRGQQAEIIQQILQGSHALVIMPTGMGKSLCYQIPAILAADSARSSEGGESRRHLTLVISPLIALMKDQVDALTARGVSASYINSSLNRLERTDRYAQVARGEFDLLYVTPERFRKGEFREVMRQRKIGLMAVDEAHCISEWGHDFRPDYTRLREFRRFLEHPTVVALTATATPEVQIDIVKQLGLESDEVLRFHEGIDRPNLHLDVVPVWDDDQKLDHLLRICHEVAGSGIIYFTLIKTLLHFSDLLRSRNVAHVVYHGELPRAQRRALQDQFMNGTNQLVLATNAFGMGIDKEDIRYVVHADVPGSMESYYQEVGRAGRDGKPSWCVLLYDQRDLATQMEFLEWSNPDAEYYQRVYDFLRHDQEQFDAFGLDWLRERLHHKNAHDRRLETTLSMLERYGVIEGTMSPLSLQVIAALPPALQDPNFLAEKRLRDQQKLYALVRYVQHEGDRKKFIHNYFGIDTD